MQDCDTLINYDIHWNPVRIIQRFGRIDRLGSKTRKSSSSTSRQHGAG
ncbi:helicase-related protein [Escherichia coli]